MKVISPAGEFEISINDSSLENNNIILKGQMGVWDSKIYLEPKDLLIFARVLCKPSILLHLAISPVRYLYNRFR